MNLFQRARFPILRNYCVFILDLQYIYQIIEFKIQKEQKKIKNCDEISKLIKAFPKDIAAMVNSF